METPEIHKQLSVSSFNEVWELLDKSDRSNEENRLMREMAHASLFHWLKREDCQHMNLSIGLWLVSRVYAVLGKFTEATSYAAECIEVSERNTLSPFCLGRLPLGQPS
tara:strand:- start:845 stop:1168 length:324 start_codon:yes stop_codon:yes gene_type:complete